MDTSPKKYKVGKQTYGKMLNIISQQGNANKTTKRYYYKLIRISKRRRMDNDKHLEECRATGILMRCWLECEVVYPPRKAVWPLLAKGNAHPRYKLSELTPRLSTPDN